MKEENLESMFQTLCSAFVKLGTEDWTRLTECREGVKKVTMKLSSSCSAEGTTASLNLEREVESIV